MVVSVSEHGFSRTPHRPPIFYPYLRLDTAGDSLFVPLHLKEMSRVLVFSLSRLTAMVANDRRQEMIFSLSRLRERVSRGRRFLQPARDG
jgi:hypothetical protein